MTKSTKIFWIVIVFTLIVAGIFAMKVSNSFTGYEYLEDIIEHEDINNIRVSRCFFGSEGILYDMNIETYEQLEENADFIVKVKISNKRKIFEFCTKSVATVLEVYKGDLEENTSIYVYEPAVINNITILEYTSGGGYQLMQEDEEYILFLNALPKLEGYQYKNDEANSYMMVSPLYSKYDVDYTDEYLNVLDEVRLDEDVSYTYTEVKEYPIITVSTEEIERYKLFWGEVITGYIQ